MTNQRYVYVLDGKVVADYIAARMSLGGVPKIKPPFKHKSFKTDVEEYMDCIPEFPARIGYVTFESDADIVVAKMFLADSTSDILTDEEFSKICEKRREDQLSIFEQSLRSMLPFLSGINGIK